MSSLHRVVTVSVIGVSGKDGVKGAQGVGKSAICNRFVRGDYDDFVPEHSSVLSQTDFSGSPVINNDHWLYWGDRAMECDDSPYKTNIRVIEQTEFLDDETYETLAGPSTSEVYSKRACRVKLESRDKLMYIQKEQLGLEAEFPQQVLPDGKCLVDCFIFVFDSSQIEGRSFDSQISSSVPILSNALKTKKPVIIALSKCDFLKEDSRRALQSLFAKKELKSSTLTVIETSAVMNVNIDELFICAVNMISKGKTRLKTQSFGEAVKTVVEYNRSVKIAYSRLLHGVLPISSWPIQRLSWSSLMMKLAIDRHPDYCAFIRVYGSASARKAYDQHVNDAREHWMGARLRALLPSLPRVFAALLDKNQVPNLSWQDANEAIHSHGLFDEYFQPLGVLGRQLDPLSPDFLYEENRSDSRIPAEILLRHEARLAFNEYKQVVEAEFRKERLEEDFESLLSETKQITPGKPLQDVCIFLQGSGAYESLPPSQACLIYDRFQNDLVQKAEMDFSECLLEHAELFVDILRFRLAPEDTQSENSFSLAEDEVDRLKEVLQEDKRYRQLSRLCELRLNMMYQFAAFLSCPKIGRCLAKGRCADLLLNDTIQQFFQRRNGSNSKVRSIDVTVHGDIALVAQFITDMNCLLRNDSYKCSSGCAYIRCYGAEDNESDSAKQPRSQLYLLDTAASIEDARSYFTTRDSSNQSSILPPIYVLVCDPGHYDLLPYMHQKGAMLADSTSGIFIGAGTAESEDDKSWSRSNDCSSIFGRDQLVRVCDTLCSSQLDRRKCEMRIQTSVLCGDPYSLELLLSTIFPDSSDKIEPVINTNVISAGIVPTDVLLPSSRSCRLDINFASYHSWLTARPITSIHGHIIVFSARRVASMAHARAAVGRVLDEGCRTISGGAILLVAVADTVHNNNNTDNEETSLLLTEGSELAESIGAQFLVISPDSPVNTEQETVIVHFFDRLKGMVSTFNPGSSEKNARDSVGYATLTDFKQLRVAPDEERTYSAYKISQSAGTLLSSGGSSASRESTLSVASPGPRPDSAPIVHPSASNPAITSLQSSAPRPRRRPAPPTYIRLPPACRQFEAAPLATPEAIEIAPEYSLVQDALTDDDHIYATLDFDAGSGGTREGGQSRSGSEKSDERKKDKKRPLRSRIFSNHSHSTEPCSSASPSGVGGFSQPSSGGEFRTPPSRGVYPLRNDPYLDSALRTGPMTSSRTQPVYQPARRPVVGPKPAYLHPQLMPPTRSITMDVINTDAVVRARRAAKIGTLPGLRQSLSAESLADLLKAKKKKPRDFGGNKFVRKVATSFRFRKGEKEDKLLGRETETKVSPVVAAEGSRSLPQSPQVERRAGKKYGSLASGGDKVSSAFSWLPSRSPKRSTKSLTAEVNQGVVSPTDTIESLTENGTIMPVFLQKCIEFIENTGGFELEGLYRVPGNQAQLSELEKAYRETLDLDLADLELPVHVVATAVKNFFSCLPEPLIPFDAHFDIIASLEKENVCSSLMGVFAKLPTWNRSVLAYFTEHLHRVASAPATAMDIHNLSKVWFPTFFRPKFDNFEEMSNGMAKFQRAMEAVLTHSQKLFS